MTPQQSVAEVGHGRVVGLVGPVGGPKDPPTDELVVDETDPEAEPVHSPGGSHPPRVVGLDLLPRARPTAEVLHHLGIRVELELPLEMLVGEWRQLQPLGVQCQLGHGSARVLGESANLDTVRRSS
jgi:hypothetical protein